MPLRTPSCGTSPEQDRQWWRGEGAYARGVSEVRVRVAREVDALAMATVVHDAFAGFVARTGVRPEPLDVDWATVVSALGARVALRDERVVGVLVLWPHPDHLLVETVAVAPAAQGCGIGTLLLAVAEREAVEAGLHTVRLVTNAAMTENLSYYPGRGFRRTGRGMQHGYDRISFEKRLDPAGA